MTAIKIEPTPTHPITYDGAWLWWFTSASKSSKKLEALTDFEVATNTGDDQNPSGYGEYLVASLSIEVSSSFPDAVIALFVEATIESSASSQYFVLTLKRDGSTIRYVDWYESTPQLPQAKFFYGDAPGEGMHTYDLYVADYYGFSAFNVSSPTILAMRFGDVI